MAVGMHKKKDPLDLQAICKSSKGLQKNNYPPSPHLVALAHLIESTSTWQPIEMLSNRTMLARLLRLWCERVNFIRWTVCCRPRRTLRSTTTDRPPLFQYPVQRTRVWNGMSCHGDDTDEERNSCVPCGIGQYPSLGGFDGEGFPRVVRSVPRTS